VFVIPDNSKYREYAFNLLNYYSYFTSKIWAAFAADLTKITNNCESFHFHFNKQFYKSYSNIFSFLEILIKTIQTDVYIKINITVKNILNHQKNSQIKID
jgi:hypothetical protein